jgi:hypothetical protein
MTISESVKKIVRRIYRITITTVLVILGVILLILILIQTGPVQNYGRSKIEAWLQNKLHTKVRIGNLDIDFPARIIIKNIYLEDLRKDTLISGGKIEVDISMFRLLSKEIRVNNLELDQVTLKVKRLMPDSVFNYQFIADAFQTAPPAEPKKTDTTSGFQFVIGTIHLQHIHALYQDDATGNYFQVNLGDFKTKVKTFDPSHQHYSIPNIAMADVSGKIRQYKPILILKHLADTISVHNQQSAPVQLQLGDIDFTRINLDYRNDGQNMDAALRLGHFYTKTDSIDLAKLHFKINQIALNNTVAVLRMGKTSNVKSEKTVAAKDTIAHAGAWSLDIGRFSIDSTQLTYDDDNKKAAKKGIDYNHLQVNRLGIHSSSLHAAPDNYAAKISEITFNEKSGFDLRKLSSDVSYSATGATLKNLVIQTNRSEIRSQVSIHYKSLSDLKKNAGNLAANLEFDKSRIAVRDILIFVPSLEEPFRDNQQAVLRLNGRVTGYLKELHIPYLEIDGVGNTSLAASGTIKGLPDAKKAYYDITISKLKSSRTDLFRFVPSKSFPASLRIPENFSANGKFAGTVNRFFVQLHLETSNGIAEIKGTLDLHQKSYDLVAGTKGLDLGYILKQDSLLGKITLNATAKGSGFDPKQMNSIFHVNISGAEFKSYTYRGVLLDANLHNGNASLVSSMKDPNLTYQLNGEAGLLNKYPSVKIKFQLDTINLQALKLVNDSLQMHLLVNADFASTDPDALQGNAFLTDLAITRGTLAIHTDSISLVAQHTDTAQSILLRSEAADIDWTGQYKLTQVSESLKQFLNKYYKLKGTGTDTSQAENWNMAVRMRPSPLVLAVMPSLAGTDSLTGNIHFNSAKKDLNISLHDDKIQINQQIIHQLNIVAETKENGLDYRVTAADAGQKGFQIYQTAVYGTLADNKLSTTLLLKDKKLKNKYIISGTLSQENKGIRFVLNPDSLLLNYQAWHLPKDNFVYYDSSGLLVRKL